MEFDHLKFRLSQTARKEWKRDNCITKLPSHCPRKAKFDLAAYRGDCPRKIENPKESDGDKWNCQGCHFLGSRVDHYEDMCTTYCEIEDVPVMAYFCQRSEFLKVTEKELERRLADVLKNCEWCYNTDRRSLRRLGD